MTTEPQGQGPLARSVSRLPEPTYGMAAVADRGQVHLIGGKTRSGETIDAVHRYDPVRDIVQDTHVTLPTPRSKGGAVSTGRSIIYFGGEDGEGNPLDEIVKIDPDTGWVTVPPVRLPASLTNLSVVWTGREAVLVGGDQGTRFSPHPSRDHRGPSVHGHLLTFDPGSEEVRILDLRGPAPAAVAGAAWVDDRLLVVGGRGDPRVMTVDLEDGIAASVTALGPLDRWGWTVATCGGSVFAFGGIHLTGSGLPLILRVNPASGALSTMRGRLPTRNHVQMAAAPVGRYVYLFGGRFTADIIRYDPTSDRTEGEKGDHVVHLDRLSPARIPRRWTDDPPRGPR